MHDQSARQEAARPPARRAAARAAVDPAWQAEYRRHRPMVERGIAWLTAGGDRRLRYHDTAKNDHWLHHRAAVLNLRRLLALGLTIDHNHEAPNRSIQRSPSIVSR